MPRTKSLSHYPDRYQEIIRECGIEGKQVRVPLPDAAACNSLRGHWYSFMGSLRQHAALLRKKQLGGTITEAELDLIQLDALAPTVMVQVMAEPCGILFQNRELSWQALALKQAVVSVAASEPTATKSLEASASRLMALQSSIDSKPTYCPVCGEAMPAEGINGHEICHSIAQSARGV